MEVIICYMKSYLSVLKFQKVICHNFRLQFNNFLLYMYNIIVRIYVFHIGLIMFPCKNILHLGLIVIKSILLPYLCSLIYYSKHFQKIRARCSPCGN
jgi:hypothetical protein